MKIYNDMRKHELPVWSAIRCVPFSEVRYMDGFMLLFIVESPGP